MTQNIVCKRTLIHQPTSPHPVDGGDEWSTGGGVLWHILMVQGGEQRGSFVVPVSLVVFCVIQLAAAKKSV